MNFTFSKVCLIGGHLSPAVAIAESLRRRKDTRILFIGRRSFFEKEKVSSVEEDVMRQLADTVLLIDVGRLTFRMFSVFQFIRSIFIARRILKKEQPHVVVSFGGYVSLPILLAAFSIGIPIVCHEQTRSISSSIQFASFFAKKVCVSYKDLVQKVPFGKGVFTGFPLRPSLFETHKKPEFISSSSKPIIYITGGTTGSVSLNKLTFALVPSLVESYTVVHQTGALLLSKANELKSSLPSSEKRNYIVQQYFSKDTVSWLLQHAKILISRSGANSVWEAAVFGIPSIFVPLPWAKQDEQLKNAQWLEQYAGAVIFDQNKQTAADLFDAFKLLEESYTQKKKSALRFAETVDRDGAHKVAGVIESFL